MSDVTFRSEGDGRTEPDPLAAVRVSGGVNARFVSDGARTLVASVAERGGYRLTTPSTFAPHLEALHVNTGGGVVGGDRIETRYQLGPGCDVVHTTVSGERVYRSTVSGNPATLDVRLLLEAGARLDWLPQQTIVYAGARLERRIEVDMEMSSRLLLVEVLTYGRPASGETAAPVALVDQWRIRRNGRLVFAEAMRLAGEMGPLLERPAVMAGGRASALVILLAASAADRVEDVRRALCEFACDSGVSAWDGLLAARIVADRPGRLISVLARAIPVLTGRPLPRVWSM